MPKHHYQKALQQDKDYMMQLLNTVYPVSDALCHELCNNMLMLELDKNTVLLKEGTTCQYLYFVLKGAVLGRATHKGKSLVTYISKENEFVTSISGFHGFKPSKEGIVTVEPTRFIALHNDIVLGLFERYFDFNYIFRTMLLEYYQSAQERSHILRVGNAKERYEYFTQTKPGFVDRIPLEHIASLLDMKYPTLVKIKKQHDQLTKRDSVTEALCRQLEQYILEQEVYRQKDCKLPTVAQAVGITAHQLSALLNNYYQQNFVDFINTYRINRIKQQMAQPQVRQHLTIEGMASEAGFSSRSAFYSAFKKQTGVSPAEYARSLQEE